jgi:hypothetical protein
LPSFALDTRRTMPTSPQTHPQVCIGAGGTSDVQLLDQSQLTGDFVGKLLIFVPRGARGDDHGMRSTPGTMYFGGRPIKMLG